MHPAYRAHEAIAHVLSGLGVGLLKQIVGIYIRLEQDELDRLKSNPAILPKYDPRVALTDGRGLDLGRAWEDLGVFLDGGVKLPDSGPTVGDQPLPNTDIRATWSYVAPERVREMAAQLRRMRRSQFRDRYTVDMEETQNIPGARTGPHGNRQNYMYKKLRELAGHYSKAADAGEGMLVRIGERM